MGAHIVVIFNIFSKQALEVPLVQWDAMIQQFSSDDADQAFANAVLPRAVGRDLLDEPWCVGVVGDNEMFDFSSAM